MALVAYGSSSDEFSEDEEAAEIVISKVEPEQNGISSNKLKLPQPKQQIIATSDEEDDQTEQLELRLPPPAHIASVIEEEDDEFLKKKAVPTIEPPKLVRKGPVQITIPSLSSFKNDESDSNNKAAKPGVSSQVSQLSGLLGLLPKPKSDFTPKKTLEGTKATTSMVPHSVMNRQKAPPPVKPAAPNKAVSKAGTSTKLLANYSESEESDTEDASDFFSFNSKEKLPEISANEIQAMVATQAAKMEAALNKFEDTIAPRNEEYTANYDTEGTSNSANHLDEEAMKALVGGSKSKRPKLSDLQVIDLSANDILQKDEWEQSHLQQETQYIPRGKITETGGGKQKKKHQITYLAQQAKANELELQAMWAQNRQSRRQTQNKYGF